MLTLTSIAKGFIRGIRNSPMALLGAILSAGLFPVLILYTASDGLGFVHYPKISFVVYAVLTWAFVLGHVLVFLGLFIFKGRKDSSLFDADEFREQFNAPRRFSSIRKLIMFVAAITIFNIAVVAAAAYNGFHYSESVAFCAELCHDVMAPERTAYTNSPHSRVECVECHIGEGATWFVRSKLSGMKQLFAVALDTYNRPIETPIHGLRPARETCEQCHRPELFHGDRLRVKNTFLEDEYNTHVRTVLLMKVGSGDPAGETAHGAHWHVSSANEIVYEHADRKRSTITAVAVEQADGSARVYHGEFGNPIEPTSGAAESRRMDCLDCHNRPTHVYLTAEEAIDEKLLSGEIPRELPYIKANAMEVLRGDYASHEEASQRIAEGLRQWYVKNASEIHAAEPPMLEQAIRGVTAAYTENVFPEMQVAFGTYENQLGHATGGGCFRCHDGLHESPDGGAISQDCELCHWVLAEEEPVDQISLREVARLAILDMAR
jgi:hypothetical protein